MKKKSTLLLILALTLISLYVDLPGQIKIGNLIIHRPSINLPVLNFKRDLEIKKLV